MQQSEKQSTRSTPPLDLPVYVRGGEKQSTRSTPPPDLPVYVRGGEKQSTRSTPPLDLPVYVRGGEARTAGHSSHVGIAALSVTANTRKGITDINTQLSV